MKIKERTMKWFKVVTVCLMLGFAFIAVSKFAIAKDPAPFYTRWYESVFTPEPAFYTRWYESVFTPEPKPAFYTRWYESVFTPEVKPEPVPFYTRWYESVFSNDEEVDEDEEVIIKKPTGLVIVEPDENPVVEPELS